MLSLLLVMLFMIALMLIRMPIAFAVGLAGIVGLIVQLGPKPALSVLARTYYTSSSGFILVAIPLFILMAHLLTAGDVTRRAITACQAWIGHLRGGLAMAAIAASVLLAALVGSSTASAAAMGATAFPEMRRHGYSDQLAAAVVSVGGTLAVMVPPSIVLVVYGVLTETSIGSLFIAGLVPGLLTALGLAAVVKFIAVTTDQAPKGPPLQLRRAIGESRHIWPISVLIVLVIGAIYGGLASPTEAAAFGVFGALLLGVAQRSISFKGFSSAVSAAIASTVMIIAIVACSAIFSNYLAFTRITHTVLEAVNGSGLPPYAILMLVVLALLLLGMVMDQLAILSLTMPLAFPAIMALDFDPIWFGIIVTKTVEIGLLTPPLGLNAYVTAGQTKVPLGTVFRGIVPFIVVDLAILGILIAFPEITLFLPSLMKH
ncbi:TRAP transporter large permease [Oricola sp.]|uniref:TRAP transporter large permease n=1 Tax=Oricola sp. TaxID=1979950 RepID=UPI0025EF31EA|nr:TRAP transporter large permease [Oricola sp.]MCI5078276.1 TRAP transporter large permease [Oricola sp.]